MLHARVIYFFRSTSLQTVEVVCSILQLGGSSILICFYILVTSAPHHLMANKFRNGMFISALDFADALASFGGIGAPGFSYSLLILYT